MSGSGRGRFPISPAKNGIQKAAWITSKRGTLRLQATALPKVFWVYLVAAGLVAAGFADFQLIAFHFQKAAVVKSTLIPVLYAVAMAVSGTGSLAFGRLFDRLGIGILVPLTVLPAISAPLVSFGGLGSAVAGAALWGLGMGVHELIIPAAVATGCSISRS